MDPKHENDRQPEPYTYEELLKDLDIGHELHFIYQGIEYSITHTPNGTINGKRLFEIWEDVEVTIIF
ncbi:hypothetical protein [Paenibacillus methanolicus]|uniref:YolD-like protein n=1 Tax=Paenibacillus methanolicus TaxID=582686 RepID=A0A5S5CH31_9BACL|nr:hypothetical protein [Paenibacillus methanolicus]TYP79022.1 hypothetical protein BCM02_101137 [Paenibacillus methanolicus]